MKKEVLFLLVLAAVVAGGAFAQRVGDTVRVTGSNDNWTVRSLSGNTLTLERVVQTSSRAPAAGPGSTFPAATSPGSTFPAKTTPATPAQKTSAPAVTTPASNGATLSFSNQQVYTFGVDPSEITGRGNFNPSDMYKYKAYSGSHTLSSNAGGSGSIKGGRMSFSVGTPPNNVLKKVDDSTISMLKEYYANVRISDASARGVGLLMKTDNGKSLQKQNQEGIEALISGGGTAGSVTMESVHYFYSDKACTVQLSGGKPLMQGYKYRMPDISISYKQGWNAVSMRMTVNIKAEKISADIKISDLSSCKWVIATDYSKR